METIATQDEELLEKYLGGEDVSRRRGQGGDPQGHVGVRLRADAVRLGVQEQGRPADARRGGRLPAVAARHRADQGHQPEGRRGDHPRSEGPRVRRVGVQDRRRPVRQADLLPRVLGRGQQGRRGLQLDQGGPRAARSHPADARRPARGPRHRDGRGHRRRPRLQERHHRRHAVRPQQPRDPRADGVPRAGHPRRHRAEDEERPGEARQGVEVAVRRGPDVPHSHRPRDRPDRDLGHGRAAPRGTGRPHAA